MKPKKTKDSLGDRQKKYEEVYNHYLVPGMTFICRVDGTTFHSYTKGMAKPFDDIINTTMQQTMMALCKDLPTCKLGYTQSDEITLVFVIDDIVKTQGLLKYRASKIISIIAAKATKYFNKYFFENVQKLEKNPKAFEHVVDIKIYKKKLFEATFDCRVFNIPQWDILNNIIWRQQDATRNSIQMLGQANFTHGELQDKNTSDVQDMLMLQKGINWNNLETYKKRGSCCYRKEVEGKKRPQWVLDLDMPILTKPEARTQFTKILFGDVKNDPLLINLSEE